VAPDQNVASALSIAVVGVGGIGSTFAYHLAHAGHDVTVIARPGSVRLQQLQRDRAIVRKSGERANVRVADELDTESAYALVLVTTMGHQVDAVLPALARSKAQSVQLMFNTFDPERLRDAIGAERCSFGMQFVMATVDGEGKLDSRISPGQKALHGDPRWARLFTDAGIPSTFEPEMRLWLRCHVPLCVAMESISVAGQRRGGGASWAESMVVARGLHQGLALIRGLGYRLYPSAKSILASAPTFAVACLLWLVSRITSFRELLATAAPECRALIDVMVAAAAAANPALPEAAIRAMKPSEPPRHSAAVPHLK
jgi:2-dehydropantoate 2-reductase